MTVSFLQANYNEAREHSALLDAGELERFLHMYALTNDLSILTIRNLETNYQEMKRMDPGYKLSTAQSDDVAKQSDEHTSEILRAYTALDQEQSMTDMLIESLKVGLARVLLPEHPVPTSPDTSDVEVEASELANNLRRCRDHQQRMNVWLRALLTRVDLDNYPA